MFDGGGRKSDDSPKGEQTIPQQEETPSIKTMKASKKLLKKRKRKRSVKVVVNFSDSLLELILWEFLFDKVNISIHSESDFVNKKETYILSGNGIDIKELVTFLKENKFSYYLTKKWKHVILFYLEGICI